MSGCDSQACDQDNLSKSTCDEPVMSYDNSQAGEPVIDLDLTLCHKSPETVNSPCV